MSETTTETNGNGHELREPIAALAQRTRITMTATIGKLMVALAAAQGEFKPIPKNRTVTVELKSGRSYDFDYATLDQVLAATRPALSRNGIAFLQIVTGGGENPWVITTILAHGEERIESETQLPGGFEGPQELGSYITYIKRYTAVSLLGVVGDEDDDGNVAEGNQMRDREPAKSPRGAQQAPKGQGASSAPAAATRGAAGNASTTTTSQKQTSASTPAVDPEHAKTLVDIRNCVGNDLKWEDKRARAFLHDLFGVTPPVPASLSKAQAAVALHLMIEAADSEDAFKAALAKARAATPDLFASPKGAAA